VGAALAAVNGEGGTLKGKQNTIIQQTLNPNGQNYLN